jgi:hypothetical protein
MSSMDFQAGMRLLASCSHGKPMWNCSPRWSLQKYQSLVLNMTDIGYVAVIWTLRFERSSCVIVRAGLVNLFVRTQN